MDTPNPMLITKKKIPWMVAFLMYWMTLGVWLYLVPEGWRVPSLLFALACVVLSILRAKFDVWRDTYDPERMVLREVIRPSGEVSQVYVYPEAEEAFQRAIRSEKAGWIPRTPLLFLNQLRILECYAAMVKGKTVVLT